MSQARTALTQKHDRFSDHAPARHRGRLTSPTRDGASPNPGWTNPNQGRTNPKQVRGRQRRRCGDEVRTIPELPARPAGNPSGRKRARLSPHGRFQRLPGRVPSASRPSSRPPARRMHRAKAQPLELRLPIQFCACCPPYVSERTEACGGAHFGIALSQRGGWRMFHHMRLRLGTVAKILGKFRF